MTAWLTRIIPDTRQRTVITDLSDAVAMHRRLMSLFPDNLGAQARAQIGLLFRIDYLHSGSATILAQSRLQPDLTQLPDRYGTTQQRPLAPMLDAFTEGMPVRFRLAANASKRLWKGDEHHRAGQIVALGKADAEQWWRDRARQRCGLQILTVHTQAGAPARGRRGHSTVNHGVTRFDGIALIHDPQALQQAVLTGIGRGKSYGCGLLSLAPVRT